MKWIIILILTGLTLPIVTGTAIYSQQTIQDVRIQPALNEARQVSNELAEKVRGLLLKEMEGGGFINAINVCSEEAQRVTHSFKKATIFGVSA
jgi:pyridoxine/pyridoxamine 5'-phosphate oxidase